MAYPAKVNVLVDGFNSTSGQDMKFQAGSNPPKYTNDPLASEEYQLTILRRNAAGTNWDLIVYDQGNSFDGDRTPAADDPVGSYTDSASQDASVTDIS